MRKIQEPQGGWAASANRSVARRSLILESGFVLDFGGPLYQWNCTLGFERCESGVRTAVHAQHPDVGKPDAAHMRPHRAG